MRAVSLPKGYSAKRRSFWKSRKPQFTECSVDRISDLGSTYASRLSAGGVADEWVAQLLRQGGAKVFKKYSEMKREALIKLNRQGMIGESALHSKLTRVASVSFISARFMHGSAPA